MSMDRSRQADADAGVAADEFLVALGAGDIAHPGGTLLSHLRRVRAMLGDWNASQDVQLAALCHACYGTDGFGTALLELTERPRLQAVIGAPAESLVYLYGSCDRAAVYPTLGAERPEHVDRFTGVRTVPAAAAMRAFAEITAANELDVVMHSAAIAAAHGEALTSLVDRVSRHLSDQALAAWRAWAEQRLSRKGC
jgi:hypothetical protein